MGLGIDFGVWFLSLCIILEVFLVFGYFYSFNNDWVNVCTERGCAVVKCWLRNCGGFIY